MIKVHLSAEPAVFDALVRKPGENYLKTKTSAARIKTKEWARHAYWGNVKAELHAAYQGICAYSCHYIPYDVGARTVEHFIPKATDRNQAYEWDNYRLACAALNGRKGTRQVLDPFIIPNDVFILDFPSVRVKVSSAINDQQLAVSAAETIRILGLNDEGTCLQARLKWVMDYCAGQYVFSHLERHAPFIGREIVRQGLEDSIKDIMLCSVAWDIYKY